MLNGLGKRSLHPPYESLYVPAYPSALAPWQKVACAEGGCGACAVVVSSPSLKGKAVAVNSCLKPVGSLHGWAVTTIEGIGGNAAAGTNARTTHGLPVRLMSWLGWSWPDW